MPQVRIKVSYPDGGSLWLTQVTALDYREDRFQPYQQVRVEAATAQPLARQEGNWMEVYIGEEKLFEGTILFQRARDDGGGRVLSLKGAGCGWYPAHNVSFPDGIVSGKKFSEMVERYAAFPGVKGVQGEDRTLNYTVVRANMTHWDILTVFGVQAYGTVPFIDREGYFWGVQPSYPSVTLDGDRLEGCPVQRMDVCASHEEAISRIYIKSLEGEYDRYLDNTDLAGMNVHRVSFFDPKDEWLKAPVVCMQYLLDCSMENQRYVEVTLCGYLPCRVCAPLQWIDGASLLEPPLQVTRVRHFLQDSRLLTQIRAAKG